MANNDSFNKLLDKITESEVVYDFVERLKLGKDFVMTYFDASTKKIFSAGTKLLDLFRPLYMNLPPLILNNIGKIQTLNLKISKGSKSCSSTFITGKNYSLLKVVSESTGMDVTSCFTFEMVGTISGNKSMKVSATFDCIYPCDDYFTIYLKEN